VGDFNYTLSKIDRSSRHKINKKTSELDEFIDYMDLADVYRIFHSAAA
jgi:hypothetical protein